MLGRLPWLALERRSRALRFLVFFDIRASESTGAVWPDGYTPAGTSTSIGRDERVAVVRGRAPRSPIGSSATIGLNRAALRVDEELLEVPADVAVVAVGVGDRRQLLVDRVPAGAVDLDLLEHRERHAVARRAERGDLLGAARLLAAELVAREAEHAEAAVAVGLLELLEPGVLRGQPALRRHVDQQQRLALAVGEVGRLAVEGVDRVLEDRHAAPACRVTGRPGAPEYVRPSMEHRGDM